MIAPSHTFTILRQSGDNGASEPRPITAADPIPLTAGSESRASAEVRSTSWDMVERFRWLDPVEALFHMGATNVSTEPEPGILLLDRRFPIWLSVLDDRAFMSVDTELLEGAARARFQVASEYLSFLSARGYSQLFDHKTRTWHRADGGGSDFVARLTVRATTRRFDHLRTDWRFGFVGAFVAYVLLELATGRSLGGSVLKGLVLGSFVNGIQYTQARRALIARIRQLRAEILSGEEPADHLTFRKRAKTVWGEIFAVVLFGTLGVGALSEGAWIGLPLVGLAAVTAPLVWRSRHAKVIVDKQSIDGLSALCSRIRIPFVDVDRVVQYPTLQLTTVSSAQRSIWIPGNIERYLQLVDVIWDRIAAAIPENTAPLTHGRRQGPDRFESILRDARQSAGFIWPVLRAACPPVWLHVFHRDNPLRRQYRWHPHLLRHGRVVLGLVVVADDRLWHVAREDNVFDAPASVVFAPDVSVSAAGELLESVVARFHAPDDEDVAELRRRLWEAGPYHLAVAVPESLSAGTRLVCSSLMIVRRYVPLGQLQSPWLPLLIDPSACPFVTVLPARYWDPAWRRSWKVPFVESNVVDASE